LKDESIILLAALTSSCPTLFLYGLCLNGLIKQNSPIKRILLQAQLPLFLKLYFARLLGLARFIAVVPLKAPL